MLDNKNNSFQRITLSSRLRLGAQGWLHWLHCLLLSWHVWLETNLTASCSILRWQLSHVSGSPSSKTHKDGAAYIHTELKRVGQCAWVIILSDAWMWEHVEDKDDDEDDDDEQADQQMKYWTSSFLSDDAVSVIHHQLRHYIVTSYHHQCAGWKKYDTNICNLDDSCSLFFWRKPFISLSVLTSACQKVCGVAVRQTSVQRDTMLLSQTARHPPQLSRPTIRPRWDSHQRNHRRRWQKLQHGHPWWRNGPSASGRQGFQHRIISSAFLCMNSEKKSKFINIYYWSGVLHLFLWNRAHV